MLNQIKNNLKNKLKECAKSQIKTIIPVKDEFGNLFKSIYATSKYYKTTKCQIKQKIKNPDLKTKNNLPKLFLAERSQINL